MSDMPPAKKFGRVETQPGAASPVVAEQKRRLDAAQKLLRMASGVGYEDVHEDLEFCTDDRGSGIHLRLNEEAYRKEMLLAAPASATFGRNTVDLNQILPTTTTTTTTAFATSSSSSSPGSSSKAKQPVRLCERGGRA